MHVRFQARTVGCSCHSSCSTEHCKDHSASSCSNHLEATRLGFRFVEDLRCRNTPLLRQRTISYIVQSRIGVPLFCRLPSYLPSSTTIFRFFAAVKILMNPFDYEFRVQDPAIYVITILHGKAQLVRCAVSMYVSPFACELCMLRYMHVAHIMSERQGINGTAEMGVSYDRRENPRQRGK